MLSDRPIKKEPWEEMKLLLSRKKPVERWNTFMITSLEVSTMDPLLKGGLIESLRVAQKILKVSRTSKIGQTSS